jgi:hypothetical protein
MANPPTQTIHVPIQTVLQKLKAVVDAGKEAEFVDKCLGLDKEQRLVLVDPALVKEVKAFLATHQLSEALPQKLAESTEFAARTMTALDDESCF